MLRGFVFYSLPMFQSQAISDLQVIQQTAFNAEQFWGPICSWQRRTSRQSNTERSLAKPTPNEIPQSITNRLHQSLQSNVEHDKSSLTLCDKSITNYIAPWNNYIKIYKTPLLLGRDKLVTSCHLPSLLTEPQSLNGTTLGDVRQPETDIKQEGMLCCNDFTDFWKRIKLDQATRLKLDLNHWITHQKQPTPTVEYYVQVGLMRLFEWFDLGSMVVFSDFAGFLAAFHLGFVSSPS